MPHEVNAQTDELVPAAEPKAGHLPLDRAVETQADLSAEINGLADAYARALKDGAPADTQPRLDYPPYRSSILRHPTKSLHHADRRPSSCTPRRSATRTYTPWDPT